MLRWEIICLVGASVESEILSESIKEPTKRLLLCTTITRTTTYWWSSSVPWGEPPTSLKLNGGHGQTQQTSPLIYLKIQVEALEKRAHCSYSGGCSTPFFLQLQKSIYKSYDSAIIAMYLLVMIYLYFLEVYRAHFFWPGSSRASLGPLNFCFEPTRAKNLTIRA